LLSAGQFCCAKVRSSCLNRGLDYVKAAKHIQNEALMRYRACAFVLALDLGSLTVNRGLWPRVVKKLFQLEMILFLKSAKQPFTFRLYIKNGRRRNSWGRLVLLTGRFAFNRQNGNFRSLCCGKLTPIRGNFGRMLRKSQFYITGNSSI